MSETSSFSRTAATVLATVSGNLCLVLATVVLGTFACFAGWLPPRGHWMYVASRLWSRLLLAASGVRVEASFEAPLDPSAAYVVMANHQSLYDIPVLIHTLPLETRFMAKKGLFQIPIFGWSMSAAGFIPVDRKNRATARQTFRIAAERLRTGLSVVVFPEETRSRDGRLLPFKKGGVLLAMRSGFPIVPVGIRGTLGVRKRASLWIRPQRVEVRYGRPLEVPAAAAGAQRELSARVRARIEELAG